MGRLRCSFLNLLHGRCACPNKHSKKNPAPSDVRVCHERQLRNAVKAISCKIPEAKNLHILPYELCVVKTLHLNVPYELTLDFDVAHTSTAAPFLRGRCDLSLSHFSGCKPTLEKFSRMLSGSAASDRSIQKL